MEFMKALLNKLFAAAAILIGMLACSESNYPGGEISPYIGIYDVRTLYKGQPVELSQDKLDGSTKLAAVVISDHSGNNLPEDLLIVQDKRRLNFLRGIAIPLGSAAKNYIPGDSLIIDISAGTLNRENGILQIKNITTDKIVKVAEGRTPETNPVTIDNLIKWPNNYESTLVAIVKGGYSYTPTVGQVISGDQLINDGFGEITVSTNSSSTLANLPQYKMANYIGIVFTKSIGDSLAPYHRMRIPEDLVELKSIYKTPKIIITGWCADPRGSDSNNEYIQFMATEDIDFAATPFSVITTNNANASTPTGFPVNGWATGGLRTYKFNLTSGFAAKGTFFYVGGPNKLINSTSSTSIAHANWITSYSYNSLGGFDFGTQTANLLANSGNAYGISVFEGTGIDKNSIPEDVMFVATGGSLWNGIGAAQEGGIGYRITNTDFYDIINPLTLKEQAFYRSGNNTKALIYTTPSDAGYFYQLGGVFNLTLGRWTTARTQTNFILEKESTLDVIENEFSTKLVD